MLIPFKHIQTTASYLDNLRRRPQWHCLRPLPCHLDAVRWREAAEQGRLVCSGDTLEICFGVYNKQDYILYVDLSLYLSIYTYVFIYLYIYICVYPCLYQYSVIIYTIIYIFYIYISISTSISICP